MLTQTATITRTPSTTVDAEGDWTSGTQTASTSPCRLEAGRSVEVFDGAERLVADALIFLPATADITSHDEVTVGGRRYQVVGQPAEMRSPAGVHHIEANLQFTASG